MRECARVAVGAAGARALSPHRSAAAASLCHHQLINILTLGYSTAFA